MSVYGRFFAVGSLILTFMSIASLADTVYQFKLFLADAIEYWHLLTGLIIQLFANFGIQIESAFIDYFILINLSFIPYFQARWSILGARRRTISTIGILFAVIYPYFLPIDMLLAWAAFAYISILIIVLVPPVERTFAIIASKMFIPPVALAILAAITEGLSRPIS